VDSKVKIRIIPAASRATQRALESNFTGFVLRDEIIVGEPPSTRRAFRGAFAPGGRTA
jgi:hypothetical protein